MVDLIFKERQGRPGNTIAQHLNVRSQVAKWAKANPTLEKPKYREWPDGLVQAFWQFETETEAVMFKLSWQ